MTINTEIIMDEIAMERLKEDAYLSIQVIKSIVEMYRDQLCSNKVSWSEKVSIKHSIDEAFRALFNNAKP